MKLDDVISTLERIQQDITFIKNTISKMGVSVHGIPKNSLCYYKDGDKWCCVFGDFQNLQESPAGFGDTQDQAFLDLKRNFREEYGITDIKTNPSSASND